MSAIDAIVGASNGTTAQVTGANGTSTYNVGTVINPDGTIKPATDGSSSTLGESDFMNLLVAQLKYQDPSSPADSSQFMTQTAQFSMLEAMQNIEKDQTKQIDAAQSTTATGMLGQKITATSSVQGSPDVVGVVTGVKLGTDGPVLKVGDMEVPFSAVKEVDRAS